MVLDPSLQDDTSFDWEPDWDAGGADTPWAGTAGLPVTLTDDLIPLDRNGQYVPNHLDANGTVHFFAAVEFSDQPNFDDPLSHLRYFRATQTGDGRLVYDSHPVMPLETGSGSPFPLPTLQLMLEDGDLESAQELAYQTARSHGLAFPEPEALPALNTGVDYAFEVGIGDDGDPALEAVKRWRDSAQDREARQPIAVYGMSEEAAMNHAEKMAVSSGALHDGRDDPRFFADGLPDPFTTNAERVRDMDGDTQRLGPIEPDTAVAAFETQFADSAYRLLQPVDPTVNYSFEVMPADPWTLELTADKWWLEANGQVGHEGQTLKTYSLESYEWEREIEREVAAMDRENLHRAYQDEGLETAMRRAAAMAVANGELNVDRDDGRMFTEGPPDRFTTARETELLGLEDTQVGEPIRDITNDETAELPAVHAPDADAPEQGSWDELFAQQHEHDEAEPEHHYWQMHYRPVDTPEGDPLGTALFVTEFPQLPPGFDDYIEANGMDDSVYPTEARTLELAHFATEDEARKFETEFRSYLVPGLLDGPELAPEVAKLEGLPGEWDDMDYRGIVDYMSGSRTIVREADDWHLHNPNAEREAEEQIESPRSNIDF